MLRFLVGLGLVVALVRVGASSVAAEPTELLSVTQLEQAWADQPVDQLRKTFAPLADVLQLDPEYRPVLRKVLTSDDKDLRRIAALALWATGARDEVALTTLVDGLADRGRDYPLWEDLRVERCLTAQGIQALPVWRAALRLDSPIARGRALMGLAKLGEAAKEALPEVARIARLPDEPLTSWAIFTRWRLDGDDRTAATELAQRLSIKRERACNGAIDRLANMGSAAREALPTMLTVMHTHRDPAVVQAIEELFPHFPAQIREALQKGLDDPLLADGAAIVLLHADGPSEQLLPHLVRLINDPKQTVIERHELAEQVSTYGPKARGAVPGLIRELSSLSGQTRLNAAGALGAIGPEAREALPALRKAQQDPDIAEAAKAAIARIEREPPNGDKR